MTNGKITYSIHVKRSDNTLGFIYSSIMWNKFKKWLTVVLTLPVTGNQTILAKKSWKPQRKRVIGAFCQSINRKLSNFFLIWDRVTQYSTKHPAQTQHCWQPLNMGLHYEHIQAQDLHFTDWCVNHVSRLLRNIKLSEQAYPRSWVQEDCQCSSADMSHWETLWVDL